MNAEGFWSRVIKSETCWLWTGSTTQEGYGNLRWDRGYAYAHRVAFEILRGAIPDGMVIDHLCRIRNCVNPAHLEPVTAAVNIRRGLTSYELRTTCKRDHDITDPANVRTDAAGGRQCRKCDVIRAARRRSA